LQGFYSVEIKHHQLQVADITGNINLLNDKFAIDSNGDYHYQSRSDLIRINEVTLEFADLHSIVIKHFNELSAALLADTVANKIYLLLASHLESADYTVEKISAVATDLKNINPVLNIDHIDFIEMNSMFSGIKIDRVAAIDHFRKKFNLF
jgi:acyl-coenzyme A synthetase/AMP-(fatty) acid ligase